MIKFDEDYKKNITLKSSKKDKNIAFNNKTKDNIDYPYWLPINEKEFIFTDIIQKQIINFTDSIKFIYFFYKDKKIYASSVLSEQFLKNLSGNLYKGFFSENKYYNSVETNKENLFFNTDTLIYCYSQESLIINNVYKGKCNIISNIKNINETIFIKFNDIIMSEKEYKLLCDNLPKETLYYQEIKNYNDYLKVKQETIMEQKKLLLEFHNMLNNAVLNNKQKLLNIAKKYNQDFEEPFIPYMYFYPTNKKIKRQKEILKYYPITGLDYSIFNYINFQPLLLKNNQITNIAISDNEYNSKINSFSEPATNFLIEYCCFNTQCFEEIFYKILEIIEDTAKMTFDYNLILPI